MKKTFRGKPLKLIQVLYELDKEKLYELREYKAKRNNEQNKKYWKLLNELSLTLRIGIEELHKEMLKNYSQRYEMMVPSSYQIRGIEYFEKKSKILKNDMEFTVYHIFVPSHELNTSEFALLLKGLIDECKEQGIETRSPKEIKRDEMLNS